MQRMDTALTQLQRFWIDYGKSFDEVCLGDLGVSESMRTIWDAMSTCWWLEDIVAHSAPSKQHETALLSLYGHLKEDLALKPWPDPSYQQQPPTQRWPTDAGMVHFYKVWWKKVYTAAHSPAFGYASRQC